MKRFLLIISLIMLTGCTNDDEMIRNEYIATKGHLMNEKITLSTLEDLPVEVITNLTRNNEEEIKYEVILINPKENMHKIKAMVVHNYYSEEIFPSIGVFDEVKELLVEEKIENSEDENPKNKIELTGIIKTTENISNMKLEIKLWLQYTNDLGEIKEIYYKTT